MTRSLLLLAIVTVANHAFAGTHVCRAEAEQLCPNLPRGKALHACVEQNLSRLSPGCRVRFEQRRDHHRQPPAPQPQ